MLWLLTIGLACGQEAAQRIDSLFEKFSGNSPGCAVGVVKDGKALLAKGYGIADLEHDVPISPASVFHMASVSKQFTAMVVLLLVEDGKIQLSDSIRKFVPELPEYAAGITLYHLLTHTSGVRDYWTLGASAGHPSEYVFTDHSALRLIAQQSALNFRPGSEYEYSNSGYFLLSLVVRRVAKKSLNDFAQERIFGPLGMKSTRFQHDHSALIAGKAFGYESRSGVWHVSNSMMDSVGEMGLYSSLEDMMRWAQNFDDPKVGAKALAIMQTRGRLSSGKEIDYGMGLGSSEYRGLHAIRHAGGHSGYKAEFSRFPAQRFSVVCLCNNEPVNPGQMARQVADIYLASEMTPTPAARQSAVAAVTLTAEERQAKVGLYRSEERNYTTIVERGGKLYPRGINAPRELIPLDKYRFTSSDAPGGLEIKFGREIPARSLELRRPGQPPLQYERISQVSLSPSEMKAYTGEFESPELNTTYRISLDAGALSVERGDQPPSRLLSADRDVFLRSEGGPEYVFQRDADGHVTGFRLNLGRMRGIQFRSRH